MLGKLRDKAQQGSVTLWSVIVTLGLFMVIGLVVDGGAQLRATQKADQLARGAARAGAQQVTTASLRGKGAIEVDSAQANQAARAYIAASDAVVTGVSVSGSTVTVYTSVTFRPALLSMVGYGSISVRGEGSAEAVGAFSGQER